MVNLKQPNQQEQQSLKDENNKKSLKCALKIAQFNVQSMESSHKLENAFSLS